MPDELRRRLHQAAGRPTAIDAGQVRARAAVIRRRRRAATAVGGSLAAVLLVTSAVIIGVVSRDSTATIQAVDRRPGTQQELDAAIFEAIRADDVETVRALLDDAASVEARTESGDFTPLMIAAFRDLVPAVEALIDAGADPNAETAGGQTAFEVAARNGAVEAWTSLVAAAAPPVDVADRSLLAAVRSRSTPMVAAVLAEGSAVDLDHPLAVAALDIGDPAIVSLLVAAGADPATSAPDGATVSDAVRSDGDPELLDALEGG